MTLNLFDQFNSPVVLGIPLVALALLLPWLLFSAPTSRWVQNRFAALQGWFMFRATNQLLLPLNFPGHKWALMFMCLMLYLITLNVLGLLPYTYTPTTQLSMNMGLAFPLWLGTVLIGFRNAPSATLAHFLPEGTPTPLIPILVIIETLSLFIRPLALGVRLTANLTAGHLMMHLVSLAVYLLLAQLPAVAIISAVLLVVLTLLEIAVALIQAYVFVLLLSLYLQENV
uniref:ATP synthase subunit a n=1 Tax=Pervagor janthinosoma TaxID=392925 RepID=B7ZHT1_PERJA|nr:ATP synthase F0 subunit 6 [Pervagor janthinosoma]BAH10452.1 ATPase subunit 6 [Pervagor janthinosoma]